MKFLDKLWVKNTILIGIPTIISALGVIYSFYESIWMMVAVLALLFIHLYFVIRYSLADREKGIELDKLRIQNESLNRANKCYTSAISSTLGLEEMWAKDINRFADAVRDKGAVLDTLWDKQILYNQVCKQCRESIEEFVGIKDGSRISVGFIECWEENSEQYVRFVSHSSSESARPSIFDKTQKLTECKYHYADLIISNCADIEIAIDNDKILRIFKDVNPGSNLSKYTQYVAIPVFCNNRKLLGIFQIVTKNGYIILDNEEKMRNFAESFLILYSNQILLIDKIRKGLYARPLD